MEGQTLPIGSRPSFPGPDIASAGILLAAAPAIGYLVTWVNLLGYANQFHISGGLIAPQLGNVLATTFGVGVGILFIFGLIVMFEAHVLRWSRGSIGPIEGRISLLVLALLLFLILAGLSWPSGSELIAVGVVLVLGAIVAFWPGVRTRGGRLRDRLRRADEARAEREVQPSIVLKELQHRLGPFWLALVFVVFFVIILAYDAGSFQAHTQTEFLVSDASTPELVLAIYGDTVIQAPFDRSKRTVKPEFDIVKISASPLHFRVMSVGPLTIQP